jgi:hypothetical protein
VTAHARPQLERHTRPLTADGSSEPLRGEVDEVRCARAVIAGAHVEFVIALVDWHGDAVVEPARELVRLRARGRPRRTDGAQLARQRRLHSHHGVAEARNMKLSGRGCVSRARMNFCSTTYDPVFLPHLSDSFLA